MEKDPILPFFGLTCGFVAGPCDLWPLRISSISDPLWCVTDELIELVQYSALLSLSLLDVMHLHPPEPSKHTVWDVPAFAVTMYADVDVLWLPQRASRQGTVLLQMLQ